MLNKIILMGRLTRDPELRQTQSGTKVASFSLAVDRDFAGQDGKRETDFIDCVAWRGTGEFAAKYFTKGQMAAVEGRLQVRDWADSPGARCEMALAQYLGKRIIHVDMIQKPVRREKEK